MNYATKLRLIYQQIPMFSTFLQICFMNILDTVSAAFFTSETITLSSLSHFTECIDAILSILFFFIYESHCCIVDFLTNWKMRNLWLFLTFKKEWVLSVATYFDFSVRKIFCWVFFLWLADLCIIGAAQNLVLHFFFFGGFFFQSIQCRIMAFSSKLQQRTIRVINFKPREPYIM